MEYSVYIFWFGGALLIATWNRNRGNSFFVGLLISFFLSPLVGFIFVALTSKKIKGIEKQMLKSKEYKKCPQCAELVKVEAMKCRFCGKELEVRFDTSPILK